MSVSGEKIALFIDGANLYATAKSLGFDIDYKRLLREFQSRGYLLRAFYYTAVIEDQEYSSIRPLIDWLDYNGYTVVTKATKEFVDQTGRRKVKGNMDIELAVDAMEIAGTIDHMVLFSGDGDFRSLVEAVQRRGVRVTVVSTISTQPPMVADELRRQADVFLDIVELQTKIGRDPSERAAREGRPPREDRAASHTPAVPAAPPRAAARRAPSGPTTTTIRIRIVTSRYHSGRALWPGPTESRARLPASARASSRSARLARARADWFNAPVPSFGPLDARLLIVGLAPGLQGANRTGRPFTGDYAGDLLYATLDRISASRAATTARIRTTGLSWSTARITNARALRAAGKQADAGRDQHLPRLPDSRPSRRCRTCAPSWRSAASRTRARCARSAASCPPRPSGTASGISSASLTLFDSYHCSRYNTNTGVLTPEMFRAVFRNVRAYLDR